MIAGGWNFVIAAYAVTFGGLAILALVVAIRARQWANRARSLDAKQGAPKS
ncbi:MAG: heme exporter protein CcmD [Proteobacteria bacterium]|nr:heme exporter protein CcmD [Pseudomonadota bacterium]